MSTYRVIGQIKYSTDNDFISNEKEFTDFLQASDYYANVFTDVSSDLAVLGGEFVITLVKDSADVEVVRRQVLSTTKHDYNEQHN
jgi:hypothetical protein